MSERCGDQVILRTAYSWPGSTAMGPWFGARMSKVRMRRSTPAVARIVDRYLFQSCVRASEGGMPTGAAAPMRGFGGVWMGMDMVRWLDALAGVLRSKTRRCESDETLDRMVGLCGLKAAE